MTRAQRLPWVVLGIVVAIASVATSLPTARAEEDVATLMREAESHENAGQWSLASSVYHKIMEHHPENALAHYRFGLIQDKLGATELARRAYSDAVRLDPNLTDARQALEGHYLKLAREARAKGQHAETIEALQQAVEANPSSATAPLELGEELERQGNVEGALQAYQKATSAAPDDVSAHVRLGNAYAKRGMHEPAAREFEQAVRLNPRNAEAHRGLGVAYGELGQREKALASFKQAVRFYVIEGDMEAGMAVEELERKLMSDKSTRATERR